MCAHLVETILVQKLQIAFSQQPQETVYSHILDIKPRPAPDGLS